eukprot:6723115-Pyramimonas_sp.AAC.1
MTNRCVIQGRMLQHRKWNTEGNATLCPRPPAIGTEAAVRRSHGRGNQRMATAEDTSWDYQGLFL